jgi:Domain of unknown function (DUF222)/HNH endonuclease
MNDDAVVALQARMADLCGHLNVLHAQLVDTIIESLDAGLWEQGGLRSPEHWLAWQTGLSPSRARQLVETARRAKELPGTFAAFADGELSVDQVVTVAKYTPAHNDTEVCELAKSATVSQLRNALSKYVHVIPTMTPAPGVDAELAGGDVRNSLVRFTDEHSRYHLSLEAPTDQGAIINQAIREARDALFLAGHTKVTWLEAFVEVCNRSLGTITSPDRRDRFRTYLHLNTDDPGGPAHAWFNGGPSLPAAIRDTLICDGQVQTLWHTAGLPINVGRARYIVPPHTRRQVLDRDRMCLRPGCGATTHLEVHHIWDWLKGGPTQTDNLVALCDRDHDALHRGEFTMVGNPDIPGDLAFHDRRGRLIPNAGTPNLPTGPPPAPPPGKKYAHPTGERFDTKWFQLTEAPTRAVDEQLEAVTCRGGRALVEAEDLVRHDLEHDGLTVSTVVVEGTVDNLELPLAVPLGAPSGGE